jgi:hypothetical protein
MPPLFTDACCRERKAGGRGCQRHYPAAYRCIGDRVAPVGPPAALRLDTSLPSPRSPPRAAREGAPARPRSARPDPRRGCAPALPSSPSNPRRGYTRSDRPPPAPPELRPEHNHRLHHHPLAAVLPDLLLHQTSSTEPSSLGRLCIWRPGWSTNGITPMASSWPASMPIGSIPVPRVLLRADASAGVAGN